MSRNVKIGTTAVALSVVWLAAGTAFISWRVPTELASFVTAAAFLLASVVSLASYVARWHIAGDRSIRRISLTEHVALNALTAGAFGALYIAVTLLPPTAASAIDGGIGPILVALILLGQGPTHRNWAGIVQPFLVCLAAASVVVVVSVSDVRVEPMRSSVGILLSAMAGVCAVGVLFLSKRLARKQVSAWAIAATRFHLGWIVSGAVAVVELGTRETPIVASELFHLLAIAFLCISAPILLLQWGIMSASTQASAFLLALLPGLVFLADLFMGASAALPLIIAVVLMLILSLAGLLPQPRVVKLS